jgi:superfamily I DNA/RNA helicase
LSASRNESAATTLNQDAGLFPTYLDDIASRQQELLQWCFDQVGIADMPAQYRTFMSTKIRRALACSESIDEYDPREVEAAQLYEAQLVDRQKIDFEAMVTRAVEIVTTDSHVRDLMQARFPYLLVDEYQDLGGVLHELVVVLHDEAGMSVFAVGDVDQSVFGFTGADPRYLNQLRERNDFADLQLSTNYRSGQDIIVAAEAALGIAHGRTAHEGRPSGEIMPVVVEGGLDSQATAAVEKIGEVLDSGIAADRVAVLYPARGVMLDEMIRAFSEYAIEYVHERDDRLPKGTISEFLQRCASRSIADYNQRTDPAIRDGVFAEVADAPGIPSLERSLRKLRQEAGLDPAATRLALTRSLQEALDPLDTLYAPASSAADWLERIINALELQRISATHPDEDNRDVLDDLGALAVEENLILLDLATDANLPGKIVLTTYHGAKGREFHTVVLPGLVQGVFPRRVSDRGVWRDPTRSELEELRRSFYVAITRAEETVYLITGPGYLTSGGYWREDGPSEFLIDMYARLEAAGLTW